MTAPIAPIAANMISGPMDAIAGPSASAVKSFTQIMTDGLSRANGQLLEAEQMTQAFAMGEDIPVHQVTFALEQARLSFELVNQVRTRLMESYQEIMRMQV